jgi:hypothetical protein
MADNGKGLENENFLGNGIKHTKLTKQGKYSQARFPMSFLPVVQWCEQVAIAK